MEFKFSKNSLYIYYIILYLILYIFTLNFNYIEGDDASTVMYHVMGRNSNIQPFYSHYHSMFDSILSLIKSIDEILLRHISIGISFIFGLFALISISYLSLYKFKKNKSILFFLVVLPFIIPEILFSSLIVNATLISITLLILSHILLLKYTANNKKLYLFLSLLFFGFGVSFRWINGFYLFVIFGDYILNDTRNFKNLFSVERIKKSLIIFPFYIASILIFIQISGFTIFDIYKTYRFGYKAFENTDTSYFALASTAIAFMTPSFIILFFLGFFYCLRSGYYRNLILLLISIIPYFFIGFYTSYKYMINIVIVLVFIMIQGISISNSKYFKISILFITFLPWFFGITLNTNSAWGPNFEVQVKINKLINLLNYNPDNSLEIQNAKIVFGAGMAVPTPEGPRSLYGFGDVFADKWFRFVEINNKERLEAVYYAERNHCKIIQDGNHSFISSKLVELGYKTKHEFKRFINGKFEREFKKENNLIIINVFKNKNELFNNELIHNLLIKEKQIVVYSSSTNIQIKLKSQHKEKFLQKGAYWGVLKI